MNYPMKQGIQQQWTQVKDAWKKEEQTSYLYPRLQTDSPEPVRQDKWYQVALKYYFKQYRSYSNWGER